MSFGDPVRNGLGVGLLASTAVNTRAGAAAITSLLMGSRFNQMGFNGYVGSDGIDLDSNTKIGSYNETGATVTKVRAVFCNWMANATNETDGFNAITVTASIEYPAGTFTQLLFSGSASVSIPATGANTIRSDEATLTTPVPAGSLYWIRTYVSVTTTQKWVQGYLILAASPNLQETADFATGVDKTMSGTIVNATATANRRGYGPAAIVATGFSGTTVNRAFAGLGDSLIMGATDVLDAAATGRGNAGYMGKACATNYPYLNLGISGASAQNNLGANMTRRLALLAVSGTTHVLCDYGVNDVIAARTAVQISGNLSSIAGSIKAAVPGIKVVQTTITPRTTGTWLTAATQVISAGGFTGGASSVRCTLNDTIRAGLTNIDTYFEAADAIEVDASNVLTRAGSLWISGNAGIGAVNTHLTTTAAATDAATTDGLHPSVTNTTAPGFGGNYILRDAVRAVFAGW